MGDKIKLEKFLELVNKCDTDCLLEFEVNGRVIDTWSGVEDIVQINKHHTIVYYKASDFSSKEKVVRIKLKC